MLTAEQQMLLQASMLHYPHIGFFPHSTLSHGLQSGLQNSVGSYCQSMANLSLLSKYQDLAAANWLGAYRYEYSLYLTFSSSYMSCQLLSIIVIWYYISQFDASFLLVSWKLSIYSTWNILEFILLIVCIFICFLCEGLRLLEDLLKLL